MKLLLRLSIVVLLLPLSSCWKPPIIGGEGVITCLLISEKVRTRVFYYANRFQGASQQIENDRRIIFEPFVKYNGWDSITTREKWLNDEAKRACDAVLYDQMCNPEFTSKVELIFDLYYEDVPPGGIDYQRFVYDLRKYPFK